MEKLPSDVQSLFCATTQINSYRRAIEELVYNAVDADSTSIAIRVNIEEQSIQVIDNGCGIAKSDFKLLGQRYATSKCVDLSTLKSAPNKYGFRGQALSSLVEVSQSLKITSRDQHSKDTWMKCFKKGKEDKVCEITQRPSKGTTVEIKGFLYNLKIQRNNIDPLSELNNIKLFLEQLALVHCNVSLSLRNDAKNEIIFQLHKNRDIYQTLFATFAIAKTDLQELKVEKNEYKVTAYIGKREKEIGSEHWIYLNGKFLQNSKLHEIVNDNLVKALKINFRGKSRVKSRKAYNNDDEIMHDSKIPTYFIFLTCPYYDYDLSVTTKSKVEFKHWEQVTKIIEKLITFYSGDVSVRAIKLAPNQNIEKTDATREKIKTIMEKILRNPSKIGVSQMQKGIKGKRIKRKANKKSQKLSLSKLKSNKNTTDLNLLDKEINSNSKVDNILELNTGNPDVNIMDGTERESNKTVRKGQQKRHIIDSKVKNKTKHLIKKNKKSKLPEESDKVIQTAPKRKKDDRKHKLVNRKPKLRKILKNRKIRIAEIPKVDPLLKKFKDDPTCSVKRRCDILADDIDNLISFKKKRKRKIFVNETIKYSDVIRNNKKYSIRKKIDEIVIHDYIPKPPQINSSVFDDRVWSKDIVGPSKSSYDLIKTVLRTQETVEDSCIEQYTNHHLGNTSHYENLNVEPVHETMESNNAHNFQNDSFIGRDVNNDLRSRPKNIKSNHLLDACTNVDMADESCMTNSGQSYKELCTTPISFFPALTFESHDHHLQKINQTSHEYNIEKENRCPKLQPRPFISIKSREDFAVPAEKSKRLRSAYKNQRYTIRKKPYTTDKKRFLKAFGNYSSNALQETSYSIEFSASEFLGNDFQCGTHYTNMIWKTNTEQPKLQNEFQNYDVAEIANNILSPKIDCTYTILNNVSPDIQIMPEFHNAIETAHNDQISENNSIIVDSATQPVKKNCDIVFISKSQEQQQTAENTIYIDPLNVCETVHSNEVLRNNQGKAKELDDSLFDHEFDVDCIFTNAQKNLFENEDVIESCNNALKKTILVDVPKPNENTKTKDKGNVNLQEFETLCENETSVPSFNFKSRLRFVPKGMSQIFQNCQTKYACDYNPDDEYFGENIYNNFADNIRSNAEIFEPGVQNVKEITTKAIERVNDRLNKDNASLIFDRESLIQAKVLRQVDNKFIAAKVLGQSQHDAVKSEYLVLFDQHAVHERIRLELNLSLKMDKNEQNIEKWLQQETSDEEVMPDEDCSDVEPDLADYFVQVVDCESDSEIEGDLVEIVVQDFVSDTQWKSIVLDNVITLKLSKDDTLYLHNYKDKFELLGLDWTVLDTGEVSIKAIPEAIIGKSPRQVEVVMKAVKNLILEEISCIKSQKGCISMYPKAIKELVFSEACRYAIKFGDKLSMNDCTDLLRSLADCKTPFQCAHGRPVMAVLMNVKDSQQQYKVWDSFITLTVPSNKRATLRINLAQVKKLLKSSF